MQKKLSIKKALYSNITRLFILPETYFQENENKINIIIKLIGSLIHSKSKKLMYIFTDRSGPKIACVRIFDQTRFIDIA